MIKQIIYTGSLRSIDKNSPGFQQLTYSENIDLNLRSYFNKISYYNRPSYMRDVEFTETNTDNYPVRYQYTRINEKFVLNKVTYLGKELRSMREGNFLSYIIFSERKFNNNPFDYLLNEQIMLSKVPEKYLVDLGEIPYMDYLEDIDLSNEYENNKNYIRSSFLETIIYAIINDKKMMIKREDNILDIIRNTYNILPNKFKEYYSFNTYIDNSDIKFENLDLINIYDQDNQNISLNQYKNQKDLLIFESEIIPQDKYYYVYYLEKHGYSNESYKTLNEILQNSNKQNFNKIDKFLPNIFSDLTEEKNIAETFDKLDGVISLFNEDVKGEILTKYFNYFLDNNLIEGVIYIYNHNYFTSELITEKIFTKIINEVSSNNNQNNLLVNLRKLIDNNVINKYDLVMLIENLNKKDFNIDDKNILKVKLIFEICNENNVNIKIINQNLISNYISYYIYNFKYSSNKELFETLNLKAKEFKDYQNVIKVISNIFNDDMNNPDIGIEFMRYIYIDSIIFGRVVKTISQILQEEREDIFIYYEMLKENIGLYRSLCIFFQEISDITKLEELNEDLYYLIMDNNISDELKVKFVINNFTQLQKLEFFDDLLMKFIENINLEKTIKINKKFFKEILYPIKGKTYHNKYALNINLYLLMTKKYNILSTTQYKITKNELSIITKFIVDNKKLILNNRVLLYYYNYYGDHFKYKFRRMLLNTDFNKSEISKIIKSLNKIDNKEFVGDIIISLLSISNLKDQIKRRYLGKI